MALQPFIQLYARTVFDHENELCTIQNNEIDSINSKPEHPTFLLLTYHPNLKPKEPTWPYVTEYAYVARMNVGLRLEDKIKPGK
jgi:hypothetical protein